MEAFLTNKRPRKVEIVKTYKSSTVVIMNDGKEWIFEVFSHTTLLEDGRQCEKKKTKSFHDLVEKWSNVRRIWYFKRSNARAKKRKS